MGKGFISRFTPSVMRACELEAVFVRREALAKQVVDLILDYARGHAKRNTLLVGGPGIGKTHLVSLVYHRARGHPEADKLLRVAWIREQGWACTSLCDVLLGILAALAEEYPNAGLVDQVASVRGLSAENVEQAAVQLVHSFVGSRRLLLIVENLDDLFSDLGLEGVKRLRAFLRECPSIGFLATSRSLHDTVSVENGAFYGFFDIHHLEELGIEEVIQLLARIGALRDNKPLLSLLRSAEGTAYIRAVYHVVGGVPRTYVALSQYLSPESLSAPDDPLLRALDDIGPYNREHMARLSTQQRKIFHLLCDRRCPVPVKEIARDGLITHQTASSQLKSMRDLEYVHSIPVGRESYYEAHVPLMRLSIEFKRHRIGEMSGLLRFLRVWYLRVDLERSLPLPDPYAALQRDFLLGPLVNAREACESPGLSPLMGEFVAYAERGDTTRALQFAEQLVSRRARPWDLFARVHCLLNLGRWDESLAEVDRIIEASPKNTLAFGARAFILAHLEQHEEAVALFDKAVELDIKSFEHIWSHRGAVLVKLHRFKEALTSSDQAIGMNPADPLARYIRGLALAHLERDEEAVSSCNSAVEVEPHYSPAWRLRGRVLCRLGRAHEAVRSYDEVIKLGPEDSAAWSCRGAALAKLGELEEALASFDRAVALGAQNAFVAFSRAQALIGLERWDGAMGALDDALDRFDRADGAVAGGTSAIVQDLFNRVRDFDTWRSRIPALVNLYDGHGRSNTLGVGLVTTIPAFRALRRDDEAMRVWRDLWTELARNVPEFELPLKFLDVAVRYHQTQDPRVLLELVVEERKLVAPLISDEAPAKARGPAEDHEFRADATEGRAS